MQCNSPISRLPSTDGAQPLPAFTSVTESFSWCKLGMAALNDYLGDDKPFLQRHLTLSSSYSGIGTPEYAFKIIVAYSGWSVKALFAFEKDASCQAELCQLFTSEDTCLFGNIADILPTKKWRKDCGFDQGCDVGASQLDSMGLWKADVKDDNLWCMVHKRPPLS